MKTDYSDLWRITAVWHATGYSISIVGFVSILVMTMTVNLFSNLHLHIFTIYILYINTYSFAQIGGPM